MTGNEGVSRLEVSTIRAGVDIGAVWDGLYRIENVVVQEVEILVDLRESEEVIQGDTTEFLPSQNFGEAWVLGTLYSDQARTHGRRCRQGFREGDHR